jgi:hypothetical protein
MFAMNVFAQDDGGRKAAKKNQKMMKRSTEMENSAKANDGAESARQLRKMEKKEAKTNKKAEKIK